MTELPDLHDATLQSIHLDWVVGTVSISLQVGPTALNRCEIRAEGVTNFIYPRLMPWGPSTSVNHVSTEEVAGGRVIAMEMQSGDQIEICCTTAGYVVVSSDV